MSAENIINRIQQDTEKEIRQILKDAEKQADALMTRAREESQQEADRILSAGKTESENIEKILVSQAQQDIKREILNAREQLIDECFVQALQQLTALQGNDYKTILTQIIKNGKKQLGETCTVFVTRDSDRQIAQKEDIQVTDTIPGSGGVIFRSADGKITIDCTFEGMLKRKKGEIRIHVGKLLFPE